MLFRHFARAAAVTGTAAVLLMAAALPSGAAPATAAGGDPAVVASWPTELQQLVAGTSAFTAALWFTEGDCQGRGGDVSAYINTFFQREAAFRRQLVGDLVKANPDLQVAVIQQQRPADDEVFPNGDTAYDVAHGVCAADLQAWGTPDAASPWGFTWAARPDDESQRRMATTGGVVKVDPLTVCSGDPGSYLCSRAFFVNCDQADTTGKQRCLDWNVSVQQHLNGMAYWIEQNKSVLDRVGEFFALVGSGVWTGGAWVISGLGWVLGQVGDAIGWAAKKGMEQVVAFFTSGAVWLWGQVTAWMINSTTPNLAGGGFVTTYNLISGVMLAMAFLIWLAGLVTAWRRGRLTGSVVGAVKAIVGIQIVGIIAFLMLQLANQATLGLIAGQQTQIANADFTVSLLQVNPVVGLIAAVLTILGLLGAGLVLIFQAPLTLGHALFGTVAAAGQAHHATQHWMGRWFIKLLSLAWCKFFMVGMTILAQNLLTSTTVNTQQNVGQQLFSVLGGMLLMLLLPTTPWLLSAIMSFTVGHASAAADRMAQGMTAALGVKAAAAAAGPALAGAGAVAGAGAAGVQALATMNSNAAALGALANGTFGTAGTGGGASTKGSAGSSDAEGSGSGAAAGGSEAAGGAAGSGDSSDSSDGAASESAPGATSAGTGAPPPDPQDADLEPPDDLHTAATARNHRRGGHGPNGPSGPGGPRAAAAGSAGPGRSTRPGPGNAGSPASGDGVPAGVGASPAAGSSSGPAGPGPQPETSSATAAPAGGAATSVGAGSNGAAPANGDTPGAAVTSTAVSGAAAAAAPQPPPPAASPAPAAAPVPAPSAAASTPQARFPAAPSLPPPEAGPPRAEPPRPPERGRTSSTPPPRPRPA
jgi:hypothetical protein